MLFSLMSALGPSLLSTVMGRHLSGNQDVGREDEEQNLGAMCWACCLPAGVLDIGIHIGRVLGPKVIDSWVCVDWCLVFETLED